MSVGIEIAFSLDDGRMTKVKSTSPVSTAEELVGVLDALFADAKARTAAVLAIPAPTSEQA